MHSDIIASSFVSLNVNPTLLHLPVENAMIVMFSCHFKMQQTLAQEAKNQLYVFLLPFGCASCHSVVLAVTGPLKEKQIAYVCRETLQVRTPRLLT